MKTVFKTGVVFASNKEPLTDSAIKTTSGDADNVVYQPIFKMK